MTGREPLLEVQGLKMHFPVRTGLLRRVQGAVRAVDGVDFEIFKRETLGLVGESGSGKSTVARTLIRLQEPTAGSIKFRGADFLSARGNALRKVRPLMQMIFQDPHSSLNPRMLVNDLVGEPLQINVKLTSEERTKKVSSLLEQVGLPASAQWRYAFEFSGGQRQRIGIARALALDPELIICDESIASLDVSMQAQVVNLLSELQRSRGLTYLFIAHDLSMVRHISDRIAVMYLGKLVEIASKADLFESARHPYTQALISAVPVPDPKIEANRQRIVLEGDIPSPIDPPKGCVFSSRCPKVQAKCFEKSPTLRQIKTGHRVACHLV